MLTSKDLLYKALDYDGFWNNSKRMMNSKPSQARKSQLDKLLAAFDISKKNAKPQTRIQTSSGHYIQTVYIISNRPKSMNRMEYIKTLTDFRYFSTGEFIADFDKIKYQDFIKRIISKVKRIFPDQSEVINKEPINLVYLFRNLYNFRLGVYHMFKFNLNNKMTEKFSV